MRRGRFAPATILPFLCASVALWTSFGAISFSEADAAAPVYGLLPPLTWLVAIVLMLLVACAVWRPTPESAAPLWLSALVLLPWLPLALPVSTFLWVGKVRVWLWAGILALVAINALRPTASLRDRARPTRELDASASAIIAGVAALMLFAAAAWTMAPQHPSGDEPHYLVITQSLLLDHDLQIENNHTRGDYHAYIRQDLRPDYLRRGTNGQIYSVHAPGLPLLVAPAFALFGFRGVMGLLTFASAVTALVVWWVVWSVTRDRRAAWFAWASAILTVPFFVHTSAVYPDGLGALPVAAGILPLVEPRARQPKWLVPIGLAVAALPWLHTRFVLLAVGIGIAVAGRLIDGPGAWMRFAAFFSAPLVSAGAWLAFFQIVYGTPNPSVVYGGASQTSVAGLWRGLPGLFIDQQYGLLANAPVFVCAIAGLAAMLWSGGRRLAAELLLIMGPYLVTVAAFHMWWGGYAAPARFLVPFTAALAIPLASWFHTRRTATERVAGTGLLLLSLLFTASVTIVGRGALVHNFRDGASQLLVWLSPAVNLTHAVPSLFQNTPTMALGQAVIWLLALAATMATGLVFERRRSAADAGPSLRLVMAVASCIAATAATSLVWRSNGATAVTPAASGIDMIRRIEGDQGLVAVALRPPQRVALPDLPRRITLSRWSGPAPASDDPLVFVGQPPLATYEIAAMTTPDARGHLRVSLDRRSPAIAEWDLAAAPGSWRREVVLPVPVGALRVDADAAARGAITSLTLRAVSVADASSPRLADREATKAARYGSAVVYLVDGRAYVEDGGTWIAGAASARFVVAPDAGTPLRLFIRNAPVVNHITVEAGEWRQDLALQPREEREIEIPYDIRQRGVPVTIAASAGARPSDVDPRSNDSRLLGCWIETR